MTDEEIFDLAERHGWQDDFGRWNFRDDGLIGFALALLKAENVSVNTPSSDDLPEIEEKHEFFCPRCGHCCRECVGLTARQRAALDELARIDAELGL